MLHPFLCPRSLRDIPLQYTFRHSRAPPDPLADAEYLEEAGGGMGLREIYRNIKLQYEDLVENIVRPER